MVRGDASNWQIAAQWAKKIMDEGDYDLRANYREVFPAHEDDYDLYENNEEHIYFVNCIENAAWFETKLYWGPRLANGEGGYSTFVGEKELIFSFEPGDQRDEVTNLYYVIDELEEEQPLDESNEDYWWPEMNIPHVNKFLPDEDEYKFPPQEMHRAPITRCSGLLRYCSFMLKQLMRQTEALQPMPLKLLTGSEDGPG
jgi:hypothetical protein